MRDDDVRGLIADGAGALGLGRGGDDAGTAVCIGHYGCQRVERGRGAVVPRSVGHRGQGVHAGFDLQHGRDRLAGVVDHPALQAGLAAAEGIVAAVDIIVRGRAWQHDVLHGAGPWALGNRAAARHLDRRHHAIGPVSRRSRQHDGRTLLDRDTVLAVAAGKTLAAAVVGDPASAEIGPDGLAVAGRGDGAAYTGGFKRLVAIPVGKMADSQFVRETSRVDGRHTDYAASLFDPESSLVVEVPGRDDGALRQQGVGRQLHLDCDA